MIHNKMPEYKQIFYVKENRVATITLNRPGKLNAYSEMMVHEILHALADARDDDEIRAVILTGAGRGFCSGAEIGHDFRYPGRYRGYRLSRCRSMRGTLVNLETLFD